MRSDALGFFWFDEPVKKEKKEPPPKRTPPERTWESATYLPYLQEALAFKPPVLTEYELFCAPKHEELIVDIECYPNYFICSFVSLLTCKVMEFEISDWADCDRQKLKFVMENFCTVGFNSNSFDVTLASLAAAGCNNEQLMWATEQIIVYEQHPSQVLKQLKVKKLSCNHIDLIEVAPLRANLKIYGGRLHCPRMQDLPFKPGTVLSWEQAQIVRYYNINSDIMSSTIALRKALQPQIMLRYEMSNEYQIDLRSKSDAQIAEAVLAAELTKLNGRRPTAPVIAPGTMYKYKVPMNMGFTTPHMRDILWRIANCDFVVANHGGVIEPPEFEHFHVKIGDMEYTMGIGGLHSTEKKTTHRSGHGYSLRDRDVASYYPFIILGQGLYPQHLGPNFLRVYKGIVDRRIAAKRAKHKNIAESLKIVINGSFGKLGSMFSILYAPDLLVQVTLSGQLYLLMMIEQMHLNGITVVSANTDGVVFKVPDHLQKVYEQIIKWWEGLTGFETEETEYLALLSRDVNNYMAIKKPDEKGVIKTKTKGAFANPWADTSNLEPWMHKNPANQICVEAMEALLTKGTPLSTTIRSCTDIRKFITVRTVKGRPGHVDGAIAITKNLLKKVATEQEMLDEVQSRGAQQIANGYWIWPGETDRAARYLTSMYEQCVRQNELNAANSEFLGKSIRWYYSTKRRGQEFVYSINGNKVPRSDGAQACLDIPDYFPLDIDYEWYEAEAQSLLVDVGYA